MERPPAVRWRCPRTPRDRSAAAKAWTDGMFGDRSVVQPLSSDTHGCGTRCSANSARDAATRSPRPGIDPEPGQRRFFAVLTLRHISVLGGQQHAVARVECTTARSRFRIGRRTVQDGETPHRVQNGETIAWRGLPRSFPGQASRLFAVTPPSPSAAARTAKSRHARNSRFRPPYRSGTSPARYLPFHSSDE